MRRGFVYLVAIVDWATRKVVSHRVSITMSTDFCVEALEEAITTYGRPEIFNTDQGSQFTSANSPAFSRPTTSGSAWMGKGRWIDNVFVERIWKSVKYEHVYLHAYENVAEARHQLATYFHTYNTNDHIPRWAGGLRTWHTSTNRWNRQREKPVTTAPLAFRLKGAGGGGVDDLHRRGST